MLQFGLIDVIQAEREREIEEAIQRRLLLEPRDEAEPPAASRRAEARPMTVRARTTEG
jgi:hypothetical protein